jgi:hypothetical protein
MLNDRPCKILDFRTLREVYTELVENHRFDRLKPPDQAFALQG